jgi:CDP-diacylglycerol pyrophosphatase
VASAQKGGDNKKPIRTRFVLGVVGVLSPIWFGGAAPAQTSPIVQPNTGGHDDASCEVAPRPNALWSLALCCSQNLHSDVGCRSYDATDDYIILKDNSRRKPAAYLIIPTIRVTGIEDKQIFLPPVVDFWKYAWQQAQLLIRKPAAEIGLAINSVDGRTENQFHIHIACVRPAVARTLADNADKIGSNPAMPADLALAPAGHVYRVIKVSSALAGAESPFKLVAAMPGAAADMAAQGVGVLGAATPGTYYVLDTTAQGANRGSAEELLDQTCGR